jgi:photosystem II stability/assembly factor-like uncharacterized protein
MINVAPKILLLLIWAGLAMAQTSDSSSTVGVYLQAITHDKKGDMWVSGSVWLLQGFLLRINSTGVTVITPPNIKSVESLHFISPKEGLMIADYRSVYKSVDAGKTWRKVFSVADYNLNRMMFVDPQRGWMVGDEGTIFQTNNGGETWQEQVNSVSVDLNQVVFVDDLHGWVSGWSMLDLATNTYPSVLLVTKDGGKTWSKLSDEKTNSFRVISFINQFEGWAVELNKHSLMRTSDGGKTWQEESRLQNQNWSHVYFLNKNQGWVTGDLVASTNDSGNTWNYQENFSKPKHSQHFSFYNPSIGGASSWLIGSNTNGADILRTFNGGRSWHAVSRSWVKPLTDRVYREKFSSLSRKRQRTRQLLQGNLNK